jgi:drug/metabolite transporter (DMT)-like permease
MTEAERRGILLILTTTAISGFSIFINKFGVKGFDPYLFAWLKNSAVAVFLMALALGVGEARELKKLRFKDWLLLAAIGLIGGSVPFLLFFKGLSMTTAASGAFIHKTMFVYVAVLGAVFLKEKVDHRLLLASCFLLLGNAFFLRIVPFGSKPGDLLIFIATLLWAGENVLSKHVLKTISPRIVALGRMGIGSLFILLFLIATGNLGATAGLTPAHFGWVLVTSALLFGYVTTWYTGLRDVKASVATSILLLGSPITALLTLFAGSAVAFPPIQILGILLLVLGVVIVVRPHELARS